MRQNIWLVKYALIPAPVAAVDLVVISSLFAVAQCAVIPQQCCAPPVLNRCTYSVVTVFDCDISWSCNYYIQTNDNYSSFDVGTCRIWESP